MTEYIFIHLSKYSVKHFYSQIDLETFYFDIKHISENHPDKTILFFHIFENLEFSKSLSFGLEAFRSIVDHFKVKYYFVLDGSYEGEHQIINSHNILYLNWGMMFVYYNVFIKKHPNTLEYNPESGKGLFFCGKGTKEHRIGLLKKFYDTDTIHNLVWSFINTDTEKNEIRNRFFSDYTDEQYQAFLNHCERILDYTPEYDDNSWTFSHNGYPCDISLYERTGFSIISETWINHSNHLFTEKTWRAIVNKHPFIMVGPIHNITKLRNLGFKTFNEYLTIPEYDRIDSNVSDRLDAIVINASDFRTLLEKKEPHIMEQLKQDTEYNHDRFTQLARIGVNKFLSALQEDESFLESILHFHNQFLAYDRSVDDNG